MCLMSRNLVIPLNYYLFFKHLMLTVSCGNVQSFLMLWSIIGVEINLENMVAVGGNPQKKIAENFLYDWEHYI